MAIQLSVPAKVSTRMKDALKRFQPILSSALARDVNESDTAAIITDLLAEMFGYDKYHEVTSEHMIRGTFCDLAVEIEGKLRLLIEVKAIGMDLKDKHMRQAANYAANQGLEWVVLTNGIKWQVYKMDFGQAIREELVVEFDLLEVTPRDNATLGKLYLLTREGMSKAVLPDYYIHKQATNRFVLGALVLSDPVVAIVRRELKKVAPGVKVDGEYLRGLLEREVLKREVVEGEPAEEARKKVQKALAKEGKTRTRSEPEPVGAATLGHEEVRGLDAVESGSDSDER
jgi:hypothetical protein